MSQVLRLWLGLTVLHGLNILLVLSGHKAIVKSALSVVNLNALVTI